MNKIAFFLFLTGFIGMGLVACSQNNIVNRWLVAGQLKAGKINPINKKNREYEFLNGGKFNIYENGTLKENGSYSMASDKKSMLLKIDNESVSLKIVKLTKNEFNFIVDIPISRNDTLVSYASNSPMAKSIVEQANDKAWNDVANSWSVVKTENQRRSDIAANLIETLKSNKDFDQSLIESLVTARSKASNIDIRPEDLTAQSVKRYQSAQIEIRTAIRKAISKVAEHPELKKSETLRQLEIQIESADNRILIAMNDYNSKVSIYNRSRKNKSSQKDISFKPEADSEKAPEVKFGNR